MLGKVEIEQVSELCRRYCAVSPDGEAVAGYFRIDGGDGAKKARKCAANVEYGELEATKAAVIQRLNSATSEFRWVFLRAMFKNDGHPAETLKIEGNPLPDDDDDEDTPKGKDSAAEALARVAIGQMRSIEQLVDRNERLHLELQESQVKGYLYQYHSEALQSSPKSELVTRAVEQIGPQIVAQLPALAAIFAAYQSGQPIPQPAADAGPPTDPPEAVCWHVDRILTSAAGLQAAFGAATPEQRQAALPQLARLRQLIATIAPLVGLRVEPTGGAAPPQEE